jgi:hypothetical protein
MKNMTKTILLRGPTLTKSGYGESCRQVVKWLFELEDQGKIKVFSELLNWGLTPWITKRDEFIDRILQTSIKTKPPIFDTTIQIQLPNEWNPVLGINNIGFTAGVEATKCNPEWIKACDRMDLVITPSQFAANLFKESKTKIAVIPHCLTEAMTKSNFDKTNFLKNLDSDFNFLFVGMFTGNNEHNDRKNILYLMKWFLEAFDGKIDNVGLIIKTSLARLSNLDRSVITKNFKEILENQLGYTGLGPKIYLLHGDMSEEEMAV